MQSYSMYSCEWLLSFSLKFLKKSPTNTVCISSSFLLLNDILLCERSKLDSNIDQAFHSLAMRSKNNKTRKLPCYTQGLVNTNSRPERLTEILKLL